MNDEDYIASLGLTAATYAPRNTALCQGQTVAIQQNVALFALVGTFYGGNGVTTYQLPDLRGTVPVGTGVSATTGEEFILGEPRTPLTEYAWPSGRPAAATTGETPTVPVASGPAGLALNWAITLYGVFPPRD